MPPEASGRPRGTRPGAPEPGAFEGFTRDRSADGRSVPHSGPPVSANRNVMAKFSLPTLGSSAPGCLLLLASLVCPVRADAQEPEVVDGVVAIAGDSVVLRSEVQERLLQMRASGAPMPEDPAGIMRLQDEIVESLINEQLLLQAAESDSTIVVSDEELEAIVQQDLDERIRNVGGMGQMVALLSEQGLNLISYREMLREQARRQRLQSLWVGRRRADIGPVVVTEAEVREFIDGQRDQLPKRPASIIFRQVLVRSEPSDSTREAARLEAERLLGLIREGEDFEELARRYSRDPSSATQGGDLGWFPRGRMVREFEDAAFGMFQEGQVSDVVETDFGAHIIRVDRISLGERRARHILITAETNTADEEAARVLADEILERARAGESMRALHEEHGHRAQPPLDSLQVFTPQLGSLPPGYLAELGSAADGDVVGPIEFDDRGKVFAVVKVLETRPEGDYTYEDLRTRVEDQLREGKVLDEIIDELRARAHVELRP